MRYEVFAHANRKYFYSLVCMNSSVHSSHDGGTRAPVRWGLSSRIRNHPRHMMVKNNIRRRKDNCLEA